MAPSLTYWGCVVEFPAALRLNGKSGEVLSWSCTQEDDLAVTCEPEDLRIKGFRDLGSPLQATRGDMEYSREKHSGLELLNLAKGAQAYGSEGAQSQF